MNDVEKDLVQIVKLALQGKDSDLRAYAKRAVAPILRNRPDLGELGSSVVSLLESNRGIRANSIVEPLPVDLDSRQELLRRETRPELPSVVTWPPQVIKALTSVVAERKQNDRLVEEGLTPSRTILFVGPPGVGKTMAAKWIAHELNRPLLTLDLSAVMSSYLGKTGNNIRVVLEFAKKSPSVLLLDEFDAIAKRRDDLAEVGELKRLVTVLLQAIDDWPTDGILIAATNHPELLDPAVWRRFDRIVEFPKPSDDLRRVFISSALKSSFKNVINSEMVEILTAITAKQSFAEIKRELERLRRHALVANEKIDVVFREFISEQVQDAPTSMKINWARSLIAAGYSQHKVNEMTGLSRDTLRKHFPQPKPKRIGKKGN